MNAVDSNLSATAGDLYNAKLHAQLWAAINDEIILPECDIYRYSQFFNSSISPLSKNDVGFSGFFPLVTTRIWHPTRSVRMDLCGHTTTFSTIVNWNESSYLLAGRSGRHFNIIITILFLFHVQSKLLTKNVSILCFQLEPHGYKWRRRFYDGRRGLPDVNR